jgi:phosphoribosylformylglycinamidine (FGAM) synthase-like enzyme
MLGRLNICSREFIATQYDHNVQGTAVMGRCRVQDGFLLKQQFHALP